MAETSSLAGQVHGVKISAPVGRRKRCSNQTDSKGDTLVDQTLVDQRWSRGDETPGWKVLQADAEAEILVKGTDLGGDLRRHQQGSEGVRQGRGGSHSRVHQRAGDHCGHSVPLCSLED